MKGPFGYDADTFLPDGRTYDGCEVAAHCLECPLPACRYDQAGLLLTWRREQRLQCLNPQGAYTIDEIAQLTGFTVRTVYRFLARGLLHRAGVGTYRLTRGVSMH